MDNALPISSASVTDRGLSDKRPQNEDSFLEMPKSGIFAVADGVGGAQAGEVASQMAMEILGEAFANFTPGADVADVMRTAIGRANSAIFQMAQELPQLANMASTVVALHIDDGTATIAHVGDSRAYYVDGNGELTRITEDHSMVAEEVRAGRMTEEQAENHPNKNIISRALGAEANVDPDVTTIAVEPGTAFLICSDGITRHVSDTEIKGVLTFGGDPVDVCEYLRGLCYERGAEDNLTAVVVKTSRPEAIADETMPAIADDEEPTIAAARSPFDSKAQDDELLELDTVEPGASSQNTTPLVEDEYRSEAPPVEDVAWSGTTETFSMFGASDENPTASDGGSSSFARFAGLIGMLVLGAAIGAGVFYFATARSTSTPEQPLTEMRAANIPLSAFEENRRLVDKDPAGYIQKVPQPQDAEDYYLIGRAYLLTGDYEKARTAFTASRDRLKDVDSANAAVLKNDLAVMMVVVNSTTTQTMLKKELEPMSANANSAKTNANR